MAFEHLTVEQQRETVLANLSNEERNLYQAQLDVATLTARMRATEVESNKSLAQVDVDAAQERVAIAEAVCAALQKELGKLPKPSAD